MPKHNQSILKRKSRLRRLKTGKNPPTLLTGKVESIPELLALIQKLIRDKNRLIETLSSGAPYISCSLAVVLAMALGRKLSLSTLSKVAVEGGSIRFQQTFSKTGRPYRKDVCLEDVTKYIKTLPGLGTNERWAEVDIYAREIAEQYNIEHAEKEAKHKKSNPKIDRYEQLGKALNFPT